MNEQDFIRYITIRKGLSDKSIRLCRIRFAIINRWLEANKKELAKDAVEEFFFYLKQKGLKNNSLNTYFFTFKYIQDYLLDRGIDNHFFKDFSAFPKGKSTIIILTPEEIERLLTVRITYGRFRTLSAETVTQRLELTHNTLCMFLAFTGCRFDEAVSLTVKYFDLSSGRITFPAEITKNKENKYAYITQPLVEKLKLIIGQKGPDELVFTSLLGKKVHAEDFRMDLIRRAKVAGITKRVHPHLFRHSFATQLLMSGVDLTMVASLLGHKDIQTTYDNCVHLADDALKKAAYRHPLVRKNIDPQEIIHMMRELIMGFHIESDSRFTYRFEEGPNSLSFTVFVK